MTNAHTAVEAVATETDVRRALLASMAERVRIAETYIGLDSPEQHHERLAILRFAVETGMGRELDELRRLHEGAGRLVADVAHAPEPAHCQGSSYYCDPDVWGCECTCRQCRAWRAL